MEGTGLHDNLHIRLFEARTLAIDTNWNTRNVCSSFWRFYHNDGDGACLRRERGDFALQGRRCYFVPAQVAFHCHNTRTIQHFYVHFDIVGISALAMRELFDAPLTLSDGPDWHGRVVELAAELVQKGRGDMALHCRIKALLYEGLAVSIEAAPPERRARVWQFAQNREPVLPALLYIESHLSASLTNGELANLCAMSENFFIRRFRECVGQTPAQYVQSRRVTQAAQQLLFTARTIEQIAEASGFGNRFYFSRVFARHTGASPAAYRKATRV